MDQDGRLQDVELSRLLRRAASAAARVYRARIAEHELTPRQAACVLALAEAPGTTLSGLAEALSADQATASALLDRLLAAGLARRETDPDDRRKARLYPTDRAALLARSLSEARRATEERIREALGSRDSEELARVLQHLIEALSSQPAASGVERQA